MKINVVNNVHGVNVVVNRNPVGGYTVTIDEVARETLGSKRPGSVVKLGNRELIVLEHSKDTTAVIAKEFAKKMPFGASADYEKSDVRRYCNGEFCRELAAAVGEENIIEHTVKLVCDDGTNKGKKCKDKVSILTTDLYRRYREFLPKYGDWWWTATGVSTEYPRYVCYVLSDGALNWGDCSITGGVRPFCVLNSSILVS